MLSKGCWIKSLHTSVRLSTAAMKLHRNLDKIPEEYKQCESPRTSRRQGHQGYWSLLGICYLSIQRNSCKGNYKHRDRHLLITSTIYDRWWYNISLARCPRIASLTKLNNISSLADKVWNTTHRVHCMYNQNGKKNRRAVVHMLQRENSRKSMIHEALWSWIHEIVSSSCMTIIAITFSEQFSCRQLVYLNYLH